MVSYAHVHIQTARSIVMEMESASPVQILYEADCVSITTKGSGKKHKSISNYW